MNYWTRMLRESLRLYFLPLAGAYGAVKEGIANPGSRFRSQTCEKCGAPLKSARH
jgi:hypothetical protein